MNDTAASQEDPIPADKVRDILARLARARVAVCGDFCLDAYWMLNPRGGEMSAETGLRAQAVGRHYYSLGGAANVVANLAALRPAHIRAIGIVGDDIFGRELLRQLRGLGVDTAGMIVQAQRFDTVTYGKRYGDDREEPRIDFGFFNQRSRETDAAVLAHLEQAVEQCDAVIFNQQVPGGLDDAFIGGLNALFEAHEDRVVLCDSRHYGARFARVCRKTNDAEAALGGTALEPGVHPALADLEAFAGRLHSASGKPVFVTRGARGILAVDAGGVHIAPGIQVLGKTDTVGAGDTVTAALALCLGAGLAPAEAAGFANLAAAVTVQKLFQTGTASPDEVLAISEDTDYVYQPELADDIRQAAYVDGTEIEACCRPIPVLSRVRQAIFANRYYQQVSTALGGSRELVAMERVLEVATEGRYDLLIVDTPPSQHALDFLDAPARIVSLLDGSMTSLLLRPYGLAARAQFRLFQQSSNAALKFFERLTGVQLFADLSEFMLAFSSLFDGFRERSHQVQRLMRAPTTGFLLVCAPEPGSLRQVRAFAERLAAEHMSILGVLANRVHPPPPPEALVLGAGDRALLAGIEVATGIAGLERRLSAIGERAVHLHAGDDLALRGFADLALPIRRVPHFTAGLRGMEDLEAFARLL